MARLCVKHGSHADGDQCPDEVLRSVTVMMADLEAIRQHNAILAEQNRELLADGESLRQQIADLKSAFLPGAKINGRLMDYPPEQRERMFRGLMDVAAHVTKVQTLLRAAVEFLEPDTDALEQAHTIPSARKIDPQEPEVAARRAIITAAREVLQPKEASHESQ